MACHGPVASPWHDLDPAMQQAFSKFDSGNWIEGRGRVQRLLDDDNDDGCHQRMILSLPGGQTLLLAHNLDIAERVPLGLGDKVDFRGLYEWNDLGGAVHWTHRDPHGKETGGYVRFRRHEYR